MTDATTLEKPAAKKTAAQKTGAKMPAAKKAAPEPKTPHLPEIAWDDAKMVSQYANIATATANKEEFFLLFGSHNHWKGSRDETKAVNVDLTHRMVMGPHAAKRLALILSHSVRAYEDQFGQIDL